MTAIPAGSAAPSPVLSGQRASRWAFHVVSWILLAFGVLAVAVATLGPPVFGWQFAVVRSGSMEPVIHTGSVAVFGDVPAEGVYRGDIVVYHLPNGTRITHRVASVADNGSSLITKGDANRTADPDPVSMGAIEGKFLFSVPYLGYAATWVRQPVGLAMVVLLPGAIVIALSILSIVRERRAGGARAISNDEMAGIDTSAISNDQTGRGIVWDPQPVGEDDTMRFPIRRHPEPAALPQPEREPVAFVPPAARLPEPAPPPAAARMPEEPVPVPVAPVIAAAAQPSTPPGFGLQIPLRSQSTANDARAERLVRVIRGEVEELRETLDQLANDRAEFLEADLEAIIADPEGAASLPAPVLVRALLMANERNQRLEAALDRKSKLAAKLKEQLRDLRVEHATVSGRMETLQEVIAALHANLQDLRADRDGARQFAPLPSGPQALRPQAEALAAPMPSLVDRE